MGGGAQVLWYTRIKPPGRGSSAGASGARGVWDARRGAGVRRGAGGAHVRHRARGPAREREGPGARADAQARCPHTAPEPRFSARIPGSQATPPHCATAPRASCRENRARAVKSKRFGNPPASAFFAHWFSDLAKRAKTRIFDRRDGDSSPFRVAKPIDLYRMRPDSPHKPQPTSQPDCARRDVGCACLVRSNRYGYPNSRMH